MAQGMRCGGLRDTCLFYGTLEGALKGLVIQVMATHDAATWVGRMRVLRKEPKPRPRMSGARILPLKGGGKGHAAAAFALVLQPPCPCTRQLFTQFGRQALGQHQCPILGALALPHDDRAVIEIQVLDPQLQALADPHARSIQKLGEQTMLPLQKPEDANHLIRGQHDRQAARRPRSSDLLKPGQIHTQHLAVEEQQGRQGLTMCRGRNLALVRQPGQKCLDLVAAQGGRMTYTVETDEGTNPVDIRLFGSYAVMQVAYALTQLVQNLDRTQRR